MGCELKTLIEIRKVVDHDTGMYRMGELSCHCSDVIQDYLIDYGEFGHNELLHMLASIQYEVVVAWRRIQRAKAEVDAQAVPQPDPEAA